MIQRLVLPSTSYVEEGLQGLLQRLLKQLSVRSRLLQVLLYKMIQLMMYLGICVPLKEFFLLQSDEAHPKFLLYHVTAKFLPFPLKHAS